MEKKVGLHEDFPVSGPAELGELTVRKSNRGIIIVFLIIFGVPIGCGIYAYIDAHFTSDIRMYQRNWGITIPGNFKKQYYISDFGGAGDGDTYEIYALEGTDTQEDASVLEEMSSQKNTETQNEIITILKRLKVDTQNYPNFSHDYQWKILNKSRRFKRLRLYILLDRKLSFIYFVQEIG